MSLRAALRDSTQAAHRRLDALWDLGRLRERGGYTMFMRATAAALVPLETRLGEAGVGALLVDWGTRARSAAIEADLAGLDAVAPSCAAPALASAGEQFGALYVLEGSRLGGTMIAREVAQSDDAVVLANRRYLGHGPAGGLWRGFVERLELLPAADTALVCAGACEAFALFETAARLAIASA